MYSICKVSATDKRYHLFLQSSRPICVNVLLQNGYYSDRHLIIMQWSCKQLNVLKIGNPDMN